MARKKGKNPDSDAWIAPERIIKQMNRYLSPDQTTRKQRKNPDSDAWIAPERIIKQMNRYLSPEQALKFFSDVLSSGPKLLNLKPASAQQEEETSSTEIRMKVRKRNGRHICHYCDNFATSIAIKEQEEEKERIWEHIFPVTRAEICTVCDKHKEEHME